MTLWNPLNVFSGTQKRAGDDPSAVVRSLADGRPAARRPGSARDRLRRDPGREPRRLRRSSQEPDRLRACRGGGHRAALSHRALLQAPPRAAAREPPPRTCQSRVRCTRGRRPRPCRTTPIDSEPDFFELDAPAPEVAGGRLPALRRFHFSSARSASAASGPPTVIPRRRSRTTSRPTDLAAAADEDYGSRELRRGEGSCSYRRRPRER